jgi:hypothetical protein
MYPFPINTSIWSDTVLYSNNSIKEELQEQRSSRSRGAEEQRSRGADEAPKVNHTQRHRHTETERQGLSMCDPLSMMILSKVRVMCDV